MATTIIQAALGPTTITYQLTYTVLADSRLDAIFKAAAMLRTGLRVVEMKEAEQSLPGWWAVVLQVEEDLEPLEPRWLHEDPDFADHPADATVDSEYAS